jgi:glycosyltransferase involved in cell wall biosynthesis
LKQLIKDEDIRIIHAHKTGSSFWAAILGKFFKVEAVVCHLHGQRLGWRNVYALRRVIAQLSAKVIAVSDFDRKKFIDMGVPPQKLVTVHNGIDYERYRSQPNNMLRTSFGLREDSRVVGICAGLRPEKSHETLLLSARQILRKRKDVYFLIIGDGEKRKALEKLANELGISSNCIFTGFRGDIPVVLSIIDIGVLCSTRESFPVAILEYMAAGKPVVATNVGGISEAVLEGVNGFLVRPGDFCDLSRKLEVLLNDQSLANTIGRSGLAIVRQAFSEDIMMKHIEDRYDEVLATKPIAVTQ